MMSKLTMYITRDENGINWRELFSDRPVKNNGVWDSLDSLNYMEVPGVEKWADVLCTDREPTRLNSALEIM
jgi:hypothetical protein